MRHTYAVSWYVLDEYVAITRSFFSPLERWYTQPFLDACGYSHICGAWKRHSVFHRVEYLHVLGGKL